MGQEATIMMREGTLNPRAKSPDWRQYLVITDRKVVLVEMTPAILFGWNFQRVTVQDGDSWGMSRDAIVAWKLANDDRSHVVTDLDPEFRAKLLTMGNGS
jgi:hypothetical protein